MIVKKYKGFDVPEGATGFCPETPTKYAAFIRNLEGRQQVMAMRNGSEDRWAYDSTELKDLIELPQEPEAYMPKAGEECEVESDCRGVWKKAMYVGVDSIGSHVFDVDKRHLWRIDSIDILVRPIKTEREKVIEWASNIAPIDRDGVFGALYDLGALTIPAKN
tara:strand:+ start:276 stop:764 length:489 start_codon:yes stop_codon:yes gene_type:complete